MVHALEEIRRVLKPNGELIDLRPVEDHWPLEISTTSGYQSTGRLANLPVAVADDEAAFHAMHEVESKGWFTKRNEVEFSYFYYWDTPSEMKDFMEQEWGNAKQLEEHTLKAVRSVWTVANADARIRLRVRMHLSIWDKRPS